MRLTVHRIRHLLADPKSRSRESQLNLFRSS
jgi:hypothetical protein